jgi:hypothetical protein
MGRKIIPEALNLLKRANTANTVNPEGDVTGSPG